MLHSPSPIGSLSTKSSFSGQKPLGEGEDGTSRGEKVSFQPSALTLSGRASTSAAGAICRVMYHYLQHVHNVFAIVHSPVLATKYITFGRYKLWSLRGWLTGAWVARAGVCLDFEARAENLQEIVILHKYLVQG